VTHPPCVEYGKSKIGVGDLEVTGGDFNGGDISVVTIDVENLGDAPKSHGLRKFAYNTDGFFGLRDPGCPQPFTTHHSL
jgi:hypothetical protein